MAPINADVLIAADLSEILESSDCGEDSVVGESVGVTDGDNAAVDGDVGEIGHTALFGLPNEVCKHGEQVHGLGAYTYKNTPANLIA